MAAKRTTPAGIAWCLVFLVLDAAQAVWFGGLLQHHDSFLIGFLVFGLSSAGCLLWVGWRAPSQFRLALAHPGALIGLNLSAVGAWMAYFLAIQRIEPAVAFMIFSGMIPLTTIIAGHLGFREGERARNRAELAGNALLLVGLGLLVLFTLDGRSGFVRGGFEVALLGLALAFVAGIMIAAMLMFSQRLDHAGLGPVSQFGLRFPLYVLCAFIGWQAGWDAKGPVAAADLALAVLIGLVLLAFPIYAVQKAVSLVSSLTLAAIAATGPVLVFAMQAVEGRVDFAPATSLGLAVCFAGAMVAAFGAARDARANRATPASRPAANP